jgi:hypothetical protein
LISRLRFVFGPSAGSGPPLSAVLEMTATEQLQIQLRKGKESQYLLENVKTILQNP